MWPKYMDEGHFLTRGKASEDSQRKEGARDNYVYADIGTSFIILVGVFFPSVTGELGPTVA